MPVKRSCRLAGRAALAAVLPVLVGAAAGQGMPERHKLTAEELLTQFRSSDTGGVAWIGKSHRVVTATENTKDPSQPLITLVDTDTGARQDVAAGTAPHVSADGKTIAFISARRDASGRVVDRQIWLVPADGSAPARQLTHQPGGFSLQDVLAFAWSKDGTKIAIPLASQVDRQQRGDSAVALGFAEVHYSDKTESQSTEMWVFDAQTGKGTKAATFPGSYIGSTQWTASGKILCEVSQGLAGIADIREIDPGSGRSELLFHGVNRQSLSPVLPPDQKSISLDFDPDPTDARYPSHHELAIMPATGGTPRVMTHGFTASSSFHWDPTGDGFWATGYDSTHLEGPGRRIFHISMSGSVVPVTPATEKALGIAVSADGQLVAFVSSQFNGLASLYVAKRDGSARREVYKLMPKGESLDLGRVSPVSWTSYDGTKLYGVLYLPSTGDGHKLPMIVDIHGGPVMGGDGGMGPLLFNTPFERSFWTGMGYAVFAVDYRQSTIYGFDKLVEARKAHENFDRDAKDIISGVDSLVKSGVADARRVVAIGHSYGSCEINWMVTHPNPFAAAISYEGCGAPVAEFAATSLDGENGSFIWTYDGYPWTNPESYRKQSTITYAAQIQTPTLFIADGLGLGRFPEAEQILYEAARHKGIPAGYILYRDEPHVIQRLQNQRDLLDRSLKWVQRFISTPVKGGASGNQ